MANRRNYGNNSGGGGNYNQGGRYQGGGGGGVNPWQSGTSPGRGGIPSLFQQNLINQLTSSDSQLALATKLLSSIFPAAQNVPPSLLSLGGGGYGPSGRFTGGSDNFPSRFKRDDRGRGGSDQFNKNRRQQHDRNRDRKGRNDKQKPKDNSTATAAKASAEVVKVEKEDDAPVVAVKKENDAEPNESQEKEGEGEAVEHLEEYEGVPTTLLHCHVCGKSMWNDVSFDTHIKGRNHQQKMRELEDSYQMQTNLMRQIAAISLKLEEVRRGKRRPYGEQYCKMCDLHFNGMTMFAHRSTEEHQGLKRFIHPSCALCNADFKARLEYDEHILTPQHLKLEAKQQVRKSLYEKDPKYVQLRQEEAKFRFMLEELTSLGNTSTPLKISEDDKKVLADLNIPAWDPEVEYTPLTEQIVPAQGYLCKVCKVFVLSKETADLHAKTHKHYEVFVARTLDRLNKKKDEDKRKHSAKDGDAGDAKRMKIDSTTDANNEDGEGEGEADADVEASSAPVDANGDVTKEVEKETATPPAAEQQSAESSPSTPSTAKRGTARRGRGRGRK